MNTLRAVVRKKGLNYLLFATIGHSAVADISIKDADLKGGEAVIEYLDVDVSRSERARYAFELSGEKALPRGFRFTRHADSENIYGIDVSHYQGDITWPQVPKSSVVFAVAKATQGGRFVDPRFEIHWERLALLRDAAIAEGNPNFFRGAYHFLSAQVDPSEQARLFLRVVGQHSFGDLPPTLDVEWDFEKSSKQDRWSKLTTEERINKVKVWLDVVEQALGRTPMIYTNYYWWKENIGFAPELSRYPLWIADYTNRSRQFEEPSQIPEGFNAWTLWQFTDRGILGGVQSEYVDVNRFNGSLYDLAKIVKVDLPIARGANGPEVVKLQDRLVALGYMSAIEKSTGPGIFGRRTESALKAFQKNSYITPNGVLDKNTLAAFKLTDVGVKKGEKNGVARYVNKRLMELQYLPKGTEETALFGAQTETAIRKFQAIRKLPVTGTLDAKTYHELNVAGSLDLKASFETWCPLGKSKKTEGHSRLALVVGVAKYKRDGDITSLPGAELDARRMYDLLTRSKISGGYGFPRQNVCVLINEMATRANFEHAFAEALVNRAEKGDVVVIYFSGHGSRIKDDNEKGIEVSGYDGTLVFYDAFTDGVWDLVDDEFDNMLGELYNMNEVHNIIVIADSCYSGSISKGLGEKRVIKFVNRPDDYKFKAGPERTWQKKRPGLVMFSAAKEDEPAYMAKDQNGSIFTNALIDVLSPVYKTPLTYNDAATQINDRLTAESQIPGFNGVDMDRVVFDVTHRLRPLNALQVKSKESNLLLLEGLPSPGMGVNAEVLIYDRTTTGPDMQVTGKAKVVARIEREVALGKYLASIEREIMPADEVRVGDYAVLHKTNNNDKQLRVRLRPADEPGGLADNHAREIRKALEKNIWLGNFVKIVKSQDPDWEYELFESGKDPEGQLILNNSDEEFVIDTQQKNAAGEVMVKLSQVMWRKDLLKKRGRGGRYFIDGKTLQVEVVPVDDTPPEMMVQEIERQGYSCSENARWNKAKPNQHQDIPLCSAWKLKVTLASDAPKNLHIGVVLLSSDGELKGYPEDKERQIELKPGGSIYFPTTKNDFFVGMPPFHMNDHILVFGTSEKREWNEVGYTFAEARPKAIKDSGDYVDLENIRDAWTMSRITTRVVP